MFMVFRSLITKGFIVSSILLFSATLNANTIDSLKNQFIALGGSLDGFNKIIQVVQKSQASSAQLKEKITQNHNKRMFDIMVANNFDSKAYTQAYGSLEEEKAQLVNQNLNDMINLLNSLSLKDRQAYAQLLYGVNNAVPNAPGEIVNNPNNNNTSIGDNE